MAGQTGYSNLLINSKAAIIPTLPNWLHNQKDTIRSTQATVPTVDLSADDLASTRQAASELANQVISTARGKNSTKKTGRAKTANKGGKKSGKSKKTGKKSINSNKKSAPKKGKKSKK
jgi:hypothetical protein